MTKLFFISPHLDDAIFSLGSFMSQTRKTNNLTVVNVFTRGTSQHTQSAKAFLHQCGESDVHKLFKSRRAEDRVALKMLGVKVVDWQQLDAMWRSKSSSTFLPAEFNAIYPTYRWHVARGHLSRFDQPLIARLQSQLINLIPKSGDYKVYCPLGVGGHVDHVLVRQVCEGVIPPANLVYWLDFPYSVRSGVKMLPLPPGFIAQKHSTQVQLKKALCSRYVSQYHLVIPDDSVLHNPETTFVWNPASRDTAKQSILAHVRAALCCPKDYLFSLLFARSTTSHPVRAFDPRSLVDAKSLVKKIVGGLPWLLPRLIGSTPLRLVGAGDLDIIVGVDHDRLAQATKLLTQMFGAPTHTTAAMVQWKFRYHGRGVDLDLLLDSSPRYLKQSYLADLLATDPVACARYQVFKLRHQHEAGLTYEVNRLLFFTELLREDRLVIPRQISTYRLKRVIAPSPGFPGSYHFGLYQNQANEQVFVKFYLGRPQGLAFQFLQNELKAYQAWGDQNQASKILIPTLKGQGINRHYSYLMLPYLETHNLSKLTPATRAAYFDQIVDLLTRSAPLSAPIFSRPPVFWLLILPLLWIKNNFRYYSLICFVIRTIPAMLVRPLGFVHRDLNFQNCLLSGSRAYLIDFQLACYADPILEYAVVLLKYYEDSSFVTAIKITTNYKRLMANPINQSILKSYMIILSLYDLTLADGRHNVTRQYLASLTQVRNNL